jgi:hypothetical protein
VLCDLGELQPLVLETTSLIEVITEEISAPWGAGPFDVFRDGGTADLKFSSQIADLGGAVIG